ncbi:DnaA regulatory inactivator Hda [Piscinibacter sp.]|uniref:DnaA regulatory inactivator Hda n=1 Tax=Piscinibacter sp. TaxID=1903157 RepID=UPI002BCFD740|nr:DnaA regulatory inactivator Hda [Albitalea sp.]HUG24839.1 DnaA regulatory inactivator Hda [Albitalea sp.]
MKQIPLALAPDHAQTFDSFVPGANQMAIEHLRQLHASSAPVYLWGPSGSGKTHLLKALAHRFQQQGGRVGWFDPANPPPWPLDDSLALTVFDACDGFDAEQQHSAFALFVDATARGTPVAAAGRVPPVDLPLRDDLRTRLGWGHVLAIQPLSEAESRGALRREADRRGLFLSDDVIDHLLTRFSRDLKHLMGLLDRLDEFALVNKRAITVPLLKQMLNEERDQ